MSTTHPVPAENAGYHQLRAMLESPETKVSAAYNYIQELFREHADLCEEKKF